MSIFDSLGIRDGPGVYDTAEFADNPESRCSIVLILDVSGSMYGGPINTLNQALVKFGEIIRDDPVTSLRADVAIVIFASEAGILLDFTNGANFHPPVIGFDTSEHLGGGTNFDAGISVALDIIEERKQSYRDGGIAYYRSLAYFLTDGAGRLDDAVSDRIFDLEENRSIAFFAFVIGGNVGALSAGLPRPAVALTNMAQLDGSIEWLSRSVAAVSQSQPGEGLRLPDQNFLQR